MMRNNLFPVAKEGWSYIGYTFVAFVVFSIIDFDFLQFISFIALAAFVFIYRNPERLTPVFEKNSVVSPVDGVILAINELDDAEYAYEIEIDNSYLDVAVLRAPLNSSVKKLSLKRGSRLSKNNPLSKLLNENCEIVFQNEDNNSVRVSHMNKQSFDNIKIDIGESQRIPQGARYGVMVNGVTKIYLPRNFRLNVNVANEVKGSETLIGYFS